MAINYTVLNAAIVAVIILLLLSDMDARPAPAAPKKAVVAVARTSPDDDDAVKPTVPAKRVAAAGDDESDAAPPAPPAKKKKKSPSPPPSDGENDDAAPPTPAPKRRRATPAPIDKEAERAAYEEATSNEGANVQKRTRVRRTPEPLPQEPVAQAPVIDPPVTPSSRWRRRRSPELQPPNEAQQQARPPPQDAGAGAGGLEQPEPEGGTTCGVVVDRCDAPVDPEAAKAFARIYKQNTLGSDGSAGDGALTGRGGSGSANAIKGAFDWIAALNKFFTKFPHLNAIADIGCGDVGWQMSVTQFNNAKIFFGGDIVRSISDTNRRRFRNHLNKAFLQWDLHACGVPKWHTTCDPTRRSFDVVMIRDALQHMNIKKVLAILRKVVFESGAKYLVTSSFNPSLFRGRAYCQQESFSAVMCKGGNITDGGFYHIALDCQPFNWPKPAFFAHSHQTFRSEDDYMHIYVIDDTLKEAVRAMGDCSEFLG